MWSALRRVFARPVTTTTAPPVLPSSHDDDDNNNNNDDACYVLRSETTTMTTATGGRAGNNARSGDHVRSDDDRTPSPSAIAVSADEAARLVNVGRVLVNLHAASEESVFGQRNSTAMQTYYQQRAPDLIMLHKGTHNSKYNDNDNDNDNNNNNNNTSNRAGRHARWWWWPASRQRQLPPPPPHTQTPPTRQPSSSASALPDATSDAPAAAATAPPPPAADDVVPSPTLLEHTASEVTSTVQRAVTAAAATSTTRHARSTADDNNSDNNKRDGGAAGDAAAPSSSSSLPSPRRARLPAVSMLPLSDAAVSTLTAAVRADREAVLRAEEDVHATLQSIEQSRDRYLVLSSTLPCEAHVAAVTQCYETCAQREQQQQQQQHATSAAAGEAAQLRATLDQLQRCGALVQALRVCTREQLAMHTRNELDATLSTTTIATATTTAT